jgi:hypothetical protein
MIELQDDDVGLPAVNARMAREVFDDAAAILGSSRRNIAQQPRFLRVAIRPVVLPPVFGEAVPAPRLELRLASPHRRELVQRLHFAAFRARSHEGERADTSISGE